MAASENLNFWDMWYRARQLMDWCSDRTIDIPKSRKAIKETHEILDAMNIMLDILESEKKKSQN